MGNFRKHGIMQVDKVLSNDTNDVDVLLGYWMPYVVGARPENVVLLVWMRFARKGHERIVVSLLSGHVWARSQFGGRSRHRR